MQSIGCPRHYLSHRLSHSKTIHKLSAESEARMSPFCEHQRPSVITHSNCKQHERLITTDHVTITWPDEDGYWCHGHHCILWENAHNIINLSHGGAYSHMEADICTRGKWPQYFPIHMSLQEFPRLLKPGLYGHYTHILN